MFQFWDITFGDVLTLITPFIIFIIYRKLDRTKEKRALKPLILRFKDVLRKSYLDPAYKESFFLSEIPYMGKKIVDLLKIGVATLPGSLFKGTVRGYMEEFTPASEIDKNIKDKSKSFPNAFNIDITKTRDAALVCADKYFLTSLRIRTEKKNMDINLATLNEILLAMRDYTKIYYGFKFRKKLFRINDAIIQGRVKKLFYTLAKKLRT